MPRRGPRWFYYDPNDGPLDDDEYDAVIHSDTCDCETCREEAWLCGEDRPIRVPAELVHGATLLDEDGYKIGEGGWDAHWFGVERIEREPWRPDGKNAA